MNKYFGGYVFCNHLSETVDHLFSMYHFFSAPYGSQFAYHLAFFIYNQLLNICVWIGGVDVFLNQPEPLFQCYFQQ